MKRLSALLSVVLLLLCSCQKQSAHYHSDLFAMDTVISIDVYGDDVTEQIENEIKRLEKLFSVTDESSEIAKLNQNSAADLSEDTKSIIASSVRYSKATDGAFDITVYPLVSLWGFTTGSNSVPSNDDIQNTLGIVGYGNIAIGEDITLSQGQIDLGAVAKGYASSKIRSILKSSDADGAVISIGGNAMLYGSKEGGGKWVAGIQHPLAEDALIATVQVGEMSVVTSGGYQRYFESGGKTYHHIIDPKTGYPADSGIISATVISDDDVLADAYSTAVYVMGVEKATGLWRKDGGFDMVLVTADKVYITSGIADDFTVRDSNFETVIIE